MDEKEMMPLISRGHIRVELEFSLGGLSIAEVNRFVERLVRLIEDAKGMDIDIHLEAGNE